MKTKLRYLKYKLVVSSALAALLLTMSTQVNAQVDTEFWFVVPELSHRGNTGGTPGTLRMATLELPATVTISMPANPYHPTLNPGGFQDKASLGNGIAQSEGPGGASLAIEPVGSDQGGTDAVAVGILVTKDVEHGLIPEVG